MPGGITKVARGEELDVFPGENEETTGATGCGTEWAIETGG